MRQVIAPRLHAHDEKLKEHDEIIDEIKEAVPALRDIEEFISVKQALHEQGLDPTVMPLYPQSRENLSGLAGQLLRYRNAERGTPIAARLDGGTATTSMNTYRRGAIYSVLEEITNNKQGSLSFND